MRGCANAPDWRRAVMDIREYFETTRGLGVLATADSQGNVGIALYSRPHVIDTDTITFIMADRQSHRNLQSNPKAAYLFREDVPGYIGKRLYIEKIREEKNSPLIDELRRKKRAESPDESGHDSFLVYFKILAMRQLTGVSD
jgi:hypothetical protein